MTVCGKQNIRQLLCEKLEDVPQETPPMTSLVVSQDASGTNACQIRNLGNCLGILSVPLWRRGHGWCGQKERWAQSIRYILRAAHAQANWKTQQTLILSIRQVGCTSWGHMAQHVCQNGI